MNEIVCATRGGEGSRAVQWAAINRAKETHDPLVFLYVVTPELFQDESPALQEAIRKEFNWLGGALLFVAQRRAQDAGISASTIIREGNVEEEICNYLNEKKASILLLGAPRGTTAKLLGEDALERFAQTVCEKTGVDVEIIHPEEYEKTFT